MKNMKKWGVLGLGIWLGLGVGQRALAQEGDGGAAAAKAIIKDLAAILENLPAIAVTIFVAVVLMMLVERLLPRLADQLPSRFRLYLLPWVPILRLLILLAATLIVLPMLLNLSAGNIFAVMGAVGLAVGFAFKDYVSSLIAGIVAIVERPYSVGDWVQIGNDYGQVKSMGMRSLRMLTPDDTEVTIPHSRIWTDNIANANGGKPDHLCVANFYVEPNHDVAAVRRKLWEVGMTSPYTNLVNGSNWREVVVIVLEEPWATHYRLKAYPIDGREEFQYISDLTTQGKAALARMGVHSVSVPAVPGTPISPRSHQDSTGKGNR